MRLYKISLAAAVFTLLFVSYGCGKNDNESKADSTRQQTGTTSADSVKKSGKPLVTFVELGSVNCIPCKMMQPVMKAIEDEFGNQIDVIFYDVWKDAAPGKKYGIKLIPTQVFLDQSGKEFFRHEGFFPKEEIEKLLVEKGLKILKHVNVEK
jgi:thioredoxin 1